MVSLFLCGGIEHRIAAAFLGKYLDRKTWDDYN
jgi:hypothetical protein